MAANITWFDLAGFLGVLLIVVAYLLLQLDKLPSSSPTYSLLNAAGALLIIGSLLFKFNFSAFLIEVFWVLISLLGLSRWLISRKRLRIKEKTITESNALSGHQ
jgi:predicted membrane protein